MNNRYHIFLQDAEGYDLRRIAEVLSEVYFDTELTAEQQLRIGLGNESGALMQMLYRETATIPENVSMPQKPYLANCSSYIELYCNKVDTGTYYAYEQQRLLEELQALPGLHIFDVGKGIFLWEDEKAPAGLEFLDRVFAERKDLRRELAALYLEPANSGTLNDTGVDISRAGYKQEAYSCYERAVALNSSYAIAWYNMACMQRDEFNNPAMARELFEQCLGADPEYTDALLNLGYLTLDERGFDAAEPYFRRALETNPTETNAYATLGYCHVENGRPEEGLAWAQLGILYGNAGNSYLNRGHVHLIRGEEEEALNCYTCSFFAFEEEDDFWKDFDSDYAIFALYNVSRETYDAFIPLIHKRVMDGPQNLREMAAFCCRGTITAAPPLSEEQAAKMRDAGYPDDFINWLQQYGNLRYSVFCKTQHDYYFQLYSGEDLDSFFAEAYSRVFLSKGLLPFASDLYSRVYLFDRNDHNRIRVLPRNRYSDPEDFFCFEMGEELDAGSLNPQEVYNEDGSFKADSVYMGNHLLKNLLPVQYENMLELLLHKTGIKRLENKETS